MDQDLAVVALDDVDGFAPGGRLPELDVNAPGLGPHLHHEHVERRQSSFDPLPRGERASVVANCPVPTLALFDGRERTSDGSLSLHLVRVGAGLRARDGFETDVRLNRSRIGSIRIQCRDGYAGV